MDECFVIGKVICIIDHAKGDEILFSERMKTCDTTYKICQLGYNISYPTDEN